MKRLKDMCDSMLVTQFGCTGTLCMSSYSRCASRSADSVTVLRRFSPHLLCVCSLFPTRLRRCGTRNIRRGRYDPAQSWHQDNVELEIKLKIVLFVFFIPFIISFLFVLYLNFLQNQHLLCFGGNLIIIISIKKGVLFTFSLFLSLFTLHLQQIVQ